MGLRAVVREPGFASVAGWLALVVGCGVTGYGLWRHLDAMQSQWQPGAIGAIAIGIGLMVGWHFLGTWCRRPPVPWAIAGIGLLAANVFGLAATLAVVLIVASSYAWGRMLLGPRSPEPSQARLEALTSVAVGTALIATVLYLCGRWPVHYRASYLALLAAPFLLRPAVARDIAGALTQPVDARRDSDHWAVALSWLGGAGLMVRWAAVIAPEIGADALAMHLYLPMQVAAKHAFVPAEAHLAWAWMPMAADWLYTLAYVLAGEAASRAMNLVCDVLVALLCHAGASSAFGRRAGALAFALYACHPLGYMLTSSLFVENTWALWLLAAWTLAWFGRRRPRWLLAAACCFAGAMSTKAFSVLYAPLLGAAVLWGPASTTSRLAPRVVAGAALLVLVLGLHPYFMAWRDTGNPVFPFLNHVFQSPLYPQSDFAIGLPYREALDFTFPYLATFATSNYLEALPGTVGVAWLLLLPLGVISVGWLGWRWLLSFALLSLAAWLTLRQMAYLRYLAPVFPMLAILLSAAGQLPRLSGRLRDGVAGCAIVACAAGLLWFPNATWWYREVLPAGWRDGAAAYAGWIREKRPERILAERIGQHGMRTVLWLGNAFYAGYTGRLFVPNWYQPVVQKQIASFHSSEDAIAWIASHHIEGIVYSSSESPCSQVWSCELLRQLGAPVDSVGSAMLYAVPDRIKFPVELLQDPSMDAPEIHWPSPAARRAFAGGLVASVANPATQLVDVLAGQDYRLEMRAACSNPHGEYRLQVNWLDRSGRMLEPDITVETCGTGFTRSSRILVAPAGARKAVVYASGHQPGEEVVFTDASLRTRPRATAAGDGL